MPKRKKKPAAPKRRGNHRGSLELRGGVWIARWMTAGKRFAKSTGCTDRKDAENWLAMRLSSVRSIDEQRNTENRIATVRMIAAGAIDEAVKDERAAVDALPAHGFKEAFTAFVNAPNKEDLAPGTVALYRTAFNDLASWVERNHPELSELRHVTIEIASAYLNDLRGRVATGTYGFRLAAIARIWNVLGELDSRLTPSPWAKMKKPKAEESPRRALTVEEIEKVVNAADGQFRRLLIIALHTGLRESDCCDLKWDAVSFDEGLIVTVAKKTGREVVVPLLPGLRAELERIPKKERVGYVVPEFAGRAQEVSAMFAQHVEGCKIKRKRADGKTEITFHSLRHTFITMAANSGIPIQVVQDAVGHLSEDMTARYRHSSKLAIKTFFAEKMPTVVPSLTDGRAGAATVEADYEVKDGGRVSRAVAAWEEMNATERTEFLERIGARLD